MILGPSPYLVLDVRMAALRPDSTESPYAGTSRRPPAPLVVDPLYERPAEGLDVRELLDTVVRGKWTILGVFLALTLPAAVFFAVRPSLYRSDVTLLVDKDRTSMSDILSAPTENLWGQQQNLSNEVLLIEQSIPLALSVAERLMRAGRIPGTGRRLPILQPDGGDSLTALGVAFRLHDDYVNALVLPEADAVQLLVTSPDPGEAAFVANVYAEEFVDLTRDANTASLSQARAFLEGQVRETEQSLVDADESVEAFMLREGAVALPEETGQLVELLGRAEAQRGEATVAVRTAGARLAALQSELEALAPNVRRSFTSGLDADLESVLERLAATEDRLETFYSATPSLRTSPTPPAEVARLRADAERYRTEIRSLREQIATQSLASGTGPSDPSSGFDRAGVLRSQIADARVSLRQAESERDQLSARIAGYERELMAIPAQSIELAQLQRDRVAAEALYGSLRGSLQEAQLAEQSQIGYAQIINPGFEPSDHYAPRRLRNVLLISLLALIVGAALAILRVRLDHRINRPDDVRDLGLTLLGTIPDTTDVLKEDFAGQDRVVVQGREVDTHLIALLNPMASASESYRAVRTSVQFSRPDAVIETILVTSANPSEGKSTTSLNLAVVFAQAGRRVLVVDADLRKPTVHQKLGLPREPGLVEALFEDGPVPESTVHEVADNLCVMPAGSTAPNPSELLGSSKMRKVIAQLQEDYDVVIFDAPPVLAATDAVLLSVQTDATVLVARAGSTKDFDVQSVTETLRGVGAVLIGVVLNGFDVNQAYGYKYKYSYHYDNKYAYGADNA